MTKPDDDGYPAPTWQSAADIPAWVPLRLLRPAVAVAIGEAGADAVTASIMRAITPGAVALRWAPDLTAWRDRAKAAGRTVQDAYTYNVTPGQSLSRPGLPPPNWCVFDQAEGIILAPGDPLCRRDPPQGEGPSWPVGPVELAWADVEALPAFRDAQARAAAAMSTPADAAEGSAASQIDKPAPLPWATDPEPWQRAQLQLIEWCDEEGKWPLPGQHGGPAKLARHLVDAAEIQGLAMSPSTAKRRVAAILATPQAERVKWPSGPLRVKNGSDPA